MRIGIGSAALKPWGDEGFKKLRELGFECLDYNICDTNMPLYHVDEGEFCTILSQKKQLAEDAGLEISQVHGPWRWPPQDEKKEDREERMEKMKKSIRACSLLGCRYWVVHPLMPFGIHDIGSGNEETTWTINVEFMRELVKTAREFDVVICLENMPMPQFSIGAPADIVRLIREIDDEHFMMCLDTGHVAVYPTLRLGDCVRECRDYLRVLHIHDNNGKADQHLIPYFGVIDWEDFGKALHDIDFQGVFSFETSPAAKLPEPVFYDMCGSLVKIAKHVWGEELQQ